LSRGEKISTDERVVYVTSMDEAIALGRRLVSEGKGKGISIIGGSQIWKEGFAYADVLSLSYIDTDESVMYDTFFPDMDMNIWKEGGREKFSKDENNQFDYEFVEYIKK
jgi:dihydrofolate reductase